MNTELQYPIGKFSWSGATDMGSAKTNIDRIAALPANLRQAVEQLSVEQWETPYRPGGWTARQVVHHVADSHMNALIRVKWTLTEDQPHIKAYLEQPWAQTAEYQLPLDTSLALLESLHLRWVTLLRSLNPAQLERSFYHPQQERLILLHELLALYAWHGEHHCAHIKLIVG